MFEAASYAWPRLPEPLRVDAEGVPRAVQVIQYLPTLGVYRWLDCLGRGHVRARSWFGWEITGPVIRGPVIRCERSFVAELEDRVREWWVADNARTG